MRYSVSGARSALFSLVLVCAVAGCSASAASAGSPAAATQLLNNMTSLERKLLADRYVSLADYNLAVQATVSCLRSKGFKVTNPALGRNGLLDYTASFSFGDASSQTGPSQKAQQHVDSLDSFCGQQSAAVQAVYVLDHAASEQQIRADFATMVACFRQAGVVIPASEKLSNVGSMMRSVGSAVQSGALSHSKEFACLADFAPASGQALPGLAEALAEMKNP
jgi:hypothetical protein